jgi:hypothetical protein
MTEQNPNPDVTDDAEGHLRHRAPGADEIEGLDSMDDTEGHGRRWAAADVDDEDDDVEGHTRKSR